jgi:hypothetical protein
MGDRMKIKRLVWLVSLVGVILNLHANSEPAQGAAVLAAELASPSIFSGLELKIFLLPGVYQKALKPTEHEIKVAQENYNQSFKKYIETHYNSPDYINRISQNSEHLGIILEAINEMNLGPEKVLYACTPLKLFDDKYHFARLVDDTVTEHILRVLPDNLSEYLTPLELEPFETIRASIEHFIIKTIAHNQTEIGKKPDMVVSHLAQGFTRSHLEAIKAHQTFLEDQNKLRLNIMNLVRTVLGKTMWSKSLPQGAWDSFVHLGYRLKTLYAKRLVCDVDDYDSLKWLLLARFIDYLDLVGSSLPLSFYEGIEEDILAREVPLLEEEVDDLIRSKRDVFIEALAGAKAKAIAYHKGIIGAEAAALV